MLDQFVRIDLAPHVCPNVTSPPSSCGAGNEGGATGATGERICDFPSQFPESAYSISKLGSRRAYRPARRLLEAMTIDDLQVRGGAHLLVRISASLSIRAALSRQRPHTACLPHRWLV
jgi:hypothetical protein